MKTATMRVPMRGSILAVLLALLAASCAPAPAAPPPQTAKPESPAGQKAAPSLAAEQVFRLPENEPTSIDPSRAGDDTTFQYLFLFWEGLVGRDRDGKLQPLGAESYNVSSDSTVFTFKLRKEAKFSDGSAITARDYEWTIKRNLDPATAAREAQQLYSIKNARAFNQGTLKDSDALGVKATDDYTLQITTEKPAAYFLSLIAGAWTAYPQKREVIEKHGDKWTEADRFVSNGPFLLQSWKHDAEMIAVRNPHYWGPKPALEKVVIKIMADPGGQSLVAYENGELDLAYVASADVDRVKNDPVLSKQMRRLLREANRWVAFDNANRPFDDVRVRKAFYLAIDRQTIADVVFKGVPVAAWTILPSTMDGYNPGAKIPGGAAEAKQLLAEAGYPEGKGFPEVELVAPSDTEYRLLTEALQPMWKSVLGVNTKINLMENRAYQNWRRSRKDQPYQAFLGGWGSDYSDPANWHNEVFDSKADFFNGRWKNAAFDELIARGQGEVDAAKRKQMYEQAEALLVGEAPVAPIYFRAAMTVVKPYVDGLVFTPELGKARLEWARMLAR